MGRRTNKFIKAITQLKSTEIDDKLAVLEAAPTNSTMGYMSTGVHGLPKPDITKTFNNFPSLPLPDFDQDDPSENGRDTSGLFNPSGVHAEGTKILVEEPPGDTSYILGPMAAMYYTWSYPWTTIGYIRESDRKMVNLAKISGKLSDWDGVSNFSSSQYGGQLTLEQAVWFRDVKKYNNSGNDPDDANYRAFYPGPPSNSPDAFGRYYCTTTGEYKNRDQTDVVPDPGRTEPNPNPTSPDEVFAAIMDRLRKGKTLSKAEEEFLDLYNIGDDGQDAAKEFIKYLGDEANKPKYANFMERIGKSGETYLKYLTNTLPEKIDNDFLGDGYINSILKKAEVQSDGTMSFHDNILGTTQVPRVVNGKLVVDFNYDFKTNAQEFAGKEDQLNWAQKTFGRFAHEVLGKYSADASTKVFGGIPFFGRGLDLLAGTVLGKGIEYAKTLGGAKHKKGQLTLEWERIPTRVRRDLQMNGLFLDRNINEAVIVVKVKETSFTPEYGSAEVLSESRKTRILKNLKKPVVVPEEQKKFKVKPKLRTPNKWMGSTPKISKPVETPKEYKQIGGRNLWGRAEYNYNVTQSQERMNQVYELVGDGHTAFDYMLTDSKKLNDEQMEKFWGKNPDFYSYFYGGKKYKLVRKEQMDGDFLVFLVDDHGEKSNILQSELNEKLAEEHEKKELEEYNKMNPKEPVSVEKDYMFKKVQKRLKPQIDYKDKPAKKGYPDEPPPEMVNNRHPDFGKPPGSSYYNKLDPKSAEAMPQQDDPEIDAKVKDAKENPKKDSAMYRRKLDDKMKKEREKFNKEEWETSDWRKELESII